MLRYLDAGESHGPGILTIVEGMPAGLKLSRSDVERELTRRRLGYGRSSRMELEGDRVEFLAGLRMGRTMGGPLAMMVENAESEKWKKVMKIEEGEAADKITKPRPGHADFAGWMKYGSGDVRDVLERASARETVGRVCAGAVARVFLRELGIEIGSHVLRVGKVEARRPVRVSCRDLYRADDDPMRCLDEKASARMMEEVNRAKEKGDSLGGVFEVVACKVPPGLGSHVHWDRRLDGRLAGAVMAIQGIKGVEIGSGFDLAGMSGSQASDEIYYAEERGIYRKTNRAGGLEGGITNGENIVLRAAMKPIPTLAAPLRTVDLVTFQEEKAFKERADVCAVPSAAVIAEAVVAFVLAEALIEKLGGDGMEEIKERYRLMVDRLGKKGWKVER